MGRSWTPPVIEPRARGSSEDAVLLLPQHRPPKPTDMPMLSLRLLLPCLSLLTLACAPPDGFPSDLLDESFDEPRCLGCTWDPPVINTHGLNGFAVSALDTTGQMYDGWRLVAVEVVIDRAVNHPVFDVRVEDGILHGTDADGVEFSGPDFVGSLWTVDLEAAGSTEVMEIVDFVEDAAASRYTFVGGGGSGNSELFTCAEDPETGEYSVVLYEDLDVHPDEGTHFHRANTIYFGCTSGAVGKAALWGYSPWNTDAQAHQTATRVVRADYCGDGTSYTAQGTGLQVADVFDVNAFADQGKDTEALWGPEGAQCLLTPRLDDYEADAISCNGAPLPACGPSDGFGQWPSALLWTKVWDH